MPTKKTTNSRTRKERVVDHVARLLCPKLPIIPVSLATYDRLDELARLTPTELPCAICGGVGLPKIEGTDCPTLNDTLCRTTGCVQTRPC
jgi:hypothetical protein